ncbi:MAG: ABC transporter substrate-binding protein, partial [Dehalococcoidia bacterium]|nr:ABC transporter substrate-binding protein [Dehalococcoidia bacterium]
VLMLAVVVSLAAAACGGGDEAEAPAAKATQSAPATARPTNTPAPPPTATAVPQPRGQLNIALSTLSGYQGIFYQTGTPHQYMDAYIDPLVGTDANNKDEPSRGFINSWQMDSTGTLWTFKTRTDVVFHNGNKASSADPAWWLLTVRDHPDVILTSKAQIKADLVSADVVDATTFTVKLAARNVFWPAVQLAMGGCGGNPCHLFDSQYFKTAGLAEYNKKPVGSGPFKVTTIQPGASITMEATEKHWFWGVPRVKTLVFHEMPEEGTAIAALKTNQMQFVTISRSGVDQIKSDAALRLVTRPGGTVNMFVPEVYRAEIAGYGKNPIADVNVRRALMWHAIDRSVLAQKFMKGYAEPTVNWPANQGDPSYEKIPVPAFDVAKAKQMLAEAGYPKGFEMDVYIWTPATQPEGPELMDALAAMWENVGLKVNRKPITLQTWSSNVQAPRKYERPAIAGVYFLGLYRFGANQVLQSASPTAVNHSFNEVDVFDKIREWAAAPSLEEYIRQGKIVQKIMVDRVHSTPAILTYQAMWAARADPTVVPASFEVTRDNMGLGLFRMGLQQKAGY